MFVATANSLETISAPLLDRCEVIECSGYATEEKMRIARRFLLPRQIEENGLSGVGVSMGDDVLHKVVSEYTREVCAVTKRKLRFLIAGRCSIARTRTWKSVPIKSSGIFELERKHA